MREEIKTVKTTCDICGNSVGDFAFASVTFDFRPIEACGITLVPKTYGAMGDDVCHTCYWRAIREAANKEVSNVSNH